MDANRTASPTALVVDADGARRELASAVLTRVGFTVLAAGSCEEGCVVAKSRAPRFALVANALADAPASETIAALRSGACGAIPVIVLIAEHGDATAFASGADDVVLAPLRPEELELRVRWLLRARVGGVEGGAEGDAERGSERAAGDERADMAREHMELLVHDLKAPIARIMAAHDYVAEDEPPREMVAGALAIIDSSARSLTRMVNGLLDLEQNDAGRLRLISRSADINALCASIAARANELGRLAKTAAVVETDLALASASRSVDEGLLGRAIENLVDNAIRYAGTHGAVRLETRGDADAFSIVVSDTGPGMSAKGRATAFEKFARADESDVRRSHGLGLYYCKTVVAAHGGSIRVEGGPGDRGARFAIEIPRPAS